MKIPTEKIDINERLFAVKVQTGENEHSWAICLRWSFNCGKPMQDEEDFQLLAIDKDLSEALTRAIKSIEEYSFKIESKLMNFLEDLTNHPDFKISIESETFEGCSQVCYQKSDTEFEYGLLSDEFEICRG